MGLRYEIGRARKPTSQLFADPLLTAVNVGNIFRRCLATMSVGDSELLSSRAKQSAVYSPSRNTLSVVMQREIKSEINRGLVYF